MPIAAVPEYLGKQDLSSASPGMRFGMYLAIWDRHNWGKEKAPGWEKICNLPPAHKEVIKGLVGRQEALAEALGGDDLLTMPAVSTAPFTTGLGNEHPTENGFSFLWPYGIPYLPGSGVKGVLRQAARELARGEWGDNRGWNEAQVAVIKVEDKPKSLTMMDALFGLESKEGEKEHFRGVLNFWDVIPEIKGNLAVDVMTPHQKHYYQEGQAPHDSGQPVPITFLTVPPGSRFTFHVTCDTDRLRKLAPRLLEGDGRAYWKRLLDAAFQHAFDWLGFGAKTAAGYGAMELDRAALEDRRAMERKHREKAEHQARLEEAVAGLPEDAAWIERQKAGGEWGDNTAFLDSLEHFLEKRDSLSDEAIDRLDEEMNKRWKGIMDNPDATKGKKQKPKFKSRPKELAKKLLGLRK